MFLTHGHGDHADGCRAFPRADVYALAAEVGLIEGKVAPPSPVGRIAGKRDSGTRVTHRLAADAVAVRTLAFAHTGPLDGIAPLRAFAAGQPAREAR